MILVDQMYARLSIGKRAFQRLLGIGSYNTILSWERGRHKPTQLFVARMAMLLCMKDEGLVVSDIRQIDWQTGTITWRRSPDDQPIQVAS